MPPIALNKIMSVNIIVIVVFSFTLGTALTFYVRCKKNCPEIHATIKTANFGQIHPEAPLDNPFEFCQTGDKFSPNSPFSSNNVTLQGAPLDIASDSPNPRQIFGQIRHFRNCMHFWT